MCCDRFCIPALHFSGLPATCCPSKVARTSCVMRTLNSHRYRYSRGGEPSSLMRLLVCKNWGWASMLVWELRYLRRKWRRLCMGSIEGIGLLCLDWTIEVSKLLNLDVVFETATDCWVIPIQTVKACCWVIPIQTLKARGDFHHNSAKIVFGRNT